MEALMLEHTQQSKLTSMLGEVKHSSLQEKRTIINCEETQNKFLDAIIRVKESLTDRTKDINDFVPRLEELTWFSAPDDEVLLQINDLIASLREYSSSLTKNYVSYRRMFHSKGIAKAELKAFKLAIDDLKEVTDDLDNVFFILPQDEEFQDLNSQLSAL